MIPLFPDQKSIFCLSNIQVSLYQGFIVIGIFECVTKSAANAKTTETSNRFHMLKEM